MSKQNEKIAFYTIKDLPSFSPVEGITMQSIAGEKMMANWVWLEPNAEMPIHEHPHEQMGAVLQGDLELITQDEVRKLNVGDAYVVLGNVQHGAVAGSEGCLVVDIFSPPREEYLAAARGES